MKTHKVIIGERLLANIFQLFCESSHQNLMLRDILDHFNPKTGGSLELELVAEAAAALGLAGERLEAALTALRKVEAKPDTPAPMREALQDAASEALWAFVIQRELLGLHDLPYIVKIYQVPREVLIKMGARKRSSASPPQPK